jgi:hypothetical protein
MPSQTINIEGSFELEALDCFVKRIRGGRWRDRAYAEAALRENPARAL